MSVLILTPNLLTQLKRGLPDSPAQLKRGFPDIPAQLKRGSLSSKKIDDASAQDRKFSKKFSKKFDEVPDRSRSG